MNRQGNGEGRGREWFSAMNKPGIQYDYLNASCCYFTDIETSSGNFGLNAVNKLPHHHPCSVHASSPFLSLFTSFSSIAIQLYRFVFHFWKTTTSVKITVRNSFFFFFFSTFFYCHFENKKCLQDSQVTLYGDDNDNHKKKKKTMLLTYILCFPTQKMATATITVTGTTIAIAMMTLRRWPDVPCPSAFDVLEFPDENQNCQVVKYEYCLQQYK